LIGSTASALLSNNFLEIKMGKVTLSKVTKGDAKFDGKAEKSGKKTVLLGGEVKPPTNPAGDHFSFGDHLFTREQAHKLFKDAGINLDDWENPSRDNWRNLAEYLADRYHPDFRGSVGNRRHKHAAYLAMLYGNVKFIREDKCLPNDKAALQYICSNFPDVLTGYKPGGHLRSLSTLETDLKRARKYVKDGKIRI
jgi:hypothetical protein